MCKTFNHPCLFCLLLALMVSSAAGCKKSSLANENGSESPGTGTRLELTQDSIYLYTKHLYLWAEQLPDYQSFHPRRYQAAATDLLNLKNELFDLASLAKNPQSKVSYEKTSLPGLLKYSYLEPGSGSNGLQAAAGISTTGTLVDMTSGNTAYLKLTQFGHLNELSVPLNEAFQRFAAASVSTLVVDLRDNPGGYVETAQYLANLISTPGMNNKVMYSQHFNAEMRQGKADILKNQPYLDENNKPVMLNGRRATYADVDYSVAGNTFLFRKEGQLKTLSKLCFLVNGATASASELLINVLKPYYETILIGSNTYGKPLGSFAVKIDRYTLYPVSFQVKNAEDDGDYFDGMQVNIKASEEQLGTEPLSILNSALLLTGQQTAKKSGHQSTAAPESTVIKFPARNNGPQMIILPFNLH